MNLLLINIINFMMIEFFLKTCVASYEDSIFNLMARADIDSQKSMYKAFFCYVLRFMYVL